MLDKNAKPCFCGREFGTYKLILMDCNMPIMDGFEATKSILKMNKKKPPYIAAVTAYNTQTFEEKCKDAGMKRFLTKPIDIHQLKSILQYLNL